MKKILSIALVALLLTSSVFAGISGDASVSLGYNFETKDYGFSNGDSISADIELAADTADVKGEGNIYAGIKAKMSLAVKPSESGKTVGGIYDKSDSEGFGIWMSVDEAYVAGENWKVDISGTKGAPDFAKSAIDTKKSDVKDAFGYAYDTKDVAVSYSVAANKVPGVTVTFADWTASFGFNGNASKDARTKAYEVKENNVVVLKCATAGKWFDYNAFVQTPVFDFNGLTLQAAAIASSNHTIKGYDEEDIFSLGLYTSAIGASAKVGYSNDTLSASFAADYGVKMLKGDLDIDIDGFVGTLEDLDYVKHGLDMAANFAIDPVTIDVYFKNEDLSNEAKKADDKVKENSLLSVQVKTDLNSFDVPVALTVAGKDLINAQDLSAKATFSLDAFEITAKFGYGIKSKKLSAGAGVKYTAEKFTAEAGADFSTVIETENSVVLALNASVSTEAIIPGAKLSLAYGKAKNDMNLLKDQATAQNLGKITAKCAIEF